METKNIKDVYQEMLNIIEARQIPRPEPIKVTKVVSYVDPEQSAAEDAPGDHERVTEEQAEENIRMRISKRKAAPTIHKAFDEEPRR